MSALKDFYVKFSVFYDLMVRNSFLTDDCERTWRIPFCSVRVCVGMCSRVFSHQGYCQGSPLHSGIVIEMKHNVNLCPEAHLVYSRSGIWPCETQQLFYFSPPLHLCLFHRVCGAKWVGSVPFPKRSKALEMDYLMAFYTTAQSLLLSYRQNCAIWHFWTDTGAVVVVRYADLEGRTSHSFDFVWPLEEHFSVAILVRF